MKRLFFAATFVALAACGRPFSAATPKGFVDLGDRYPEGEYRAATADGVVIGVRAFENDPKGELGFWARALENRMHDLGGYALLEKKEVVDRIGQKGVELKMGHDEGREPHVYIVTLFVTDAKIFVVEAGGTKSEMDREAAQIDWAIRNFLPK